MDGWIPVVVSVDRPIVSQSTKYLLKAYKNGYLATSLPSILEYLKPLMPPERHDPDGEQQQPEEAFVLALNDVPLPWHWPTGLLCDHYQFELPCQLTLKRGSLALSALDIRTYWLQQIKESCYIRNGNANAIMNMSTADSSIVWAAVCDHDFQQYDQMMKPLIKGYKNIPIKLYHQSKVIYKLASPDVSLGVFLNEHLPDTFASTRVALDAHPYLLGAKVPLQAPVKELYEFSYIDGFLHISIY